MKEHYSNLMYAHAIRHGFRINSNTCDRLAVAGHNSAVAWLRLGFESAHAQPVALQDAALRCGLSKNQSYVMDRAYDKFYVFGDDEYID